MVDWSWWQVPHVAVDELRSHIFHGGLDDLVVWKCVIQTYSNHHDGNFNHVGTSKSVSIHVLISFWLWCKHRDVKTETCVYRQLWTTPVRVMISILETQKWWFDFEQKIWISFKSTSCWRLWRDNSFKTNLLLRCVDENMILRSDDEVHQQSPNSMAPWVIFFFAIHNNSQHVGVQVVVKWNVTAVSPKRSLGKKISEILLLEAISFS